MVSKIFHLGLSVSTRNWQGKFYGMCPGDHIYHEIISIGMGLWEMICFGNAQKRVTGFTFNTVAANLMFMLNELICRLFFNYFLYLFPELLWVSDSRGEYVGWFLCGVRFFGGIFKQTWLKVTNHLISRAYNQIILSVIGVFDFQKY